MAKSVRIGGVDFEQFSLFKHSGKENTQTTFFLYQCSLKKLQKFCKLFTNPSLRWKTENVMLDQTETFVAAASARLSLLCAMQAP